VRQHHRGLAVVRSGHDDPDAGGHREAPAADGDRLVERLDDELVEPGRLRRRDADRELVTAQPGDQRVLGHRQPEPPGDLVQHGVAGVVAMGVVDVLEVVEVQQRERHRAGVGGQQRRQPLVQGGPVAEPGERVALRSRGGLALARPQPADGVLLLGAREQLAQDQEGPEDDDDGHLQDGEGLALGDEAARQHESGHAREVGRRRLQQAGGGRLLGDQLHRLPGSQRRHPHQHETRLGDHRRPGGGGVPAVQDPDAVADVARRQQREAQAGGVEERAQLLLHPGQHGQHHGQHDGTADQIAERRPGGGRVAVRMAGHRADDAGQQEGQPGHRDQRVQQGLAAPRAVERVAGQRQQAGDGKWSVAQVEPVGGGTGGGRLAGEQQVPRGGEPAADPDQQRAGQQRPGPPPGRGPDPEQAHDCEHRRDGPDAVRQGGRERHQDQGRGDGTPKQPPPRPGHG
jgi:hypothetical protein